MIRIAVAQIAPVVGAFESNAKKILEAYERACGSQARLLLTPELGICGYPPHDLVERPEMFERTERVLDELAAATKGKQCALAVGHVGLTSSAHGRAAQNLVTILENGKRVFSQAKTLLPTYDVFDEARYFEPATECAPWTCDGIKIAIAICEDLWARDPALGRKLYGTDPVERYRAGGAKIIVSLSASPFEWGKRERREALHGEIARELKAPLVYINQVGANDEILFDGSSFAVGADGKVVGRLKAFETSFGVVEVEAGGSAKFVEPATHEREDQAPTDVDAVARGLVTGIRDYFQRTGFRTAMLGVSGGIDSAVVAVLAAKALGPENVLGIAMPSQYSSSHSLEDAEALVRKVGMRYEVRPIKFLNSTAAREIGEARGGLAPIALENLQSRLRGLTLMTLSNHYGALVFSTGNKSELAMGYCTMYGDMCGALSPIGDLYKTRVYELARHINASPDFFGGGAIPERSISKAPSAELKPDQTDQDTLPPYDALDAVLAAYIEARQPIAEIEAQLTKLAPKRGKTWVRDVLKSVEINEYKRRQAAPVLKVTSKAFGIGRRMPIAKSWTV